MLVHGEDDNRAPIDHAYAMREALRDAGTDPDWLKIDDSGHGAGNMKTRLELYEAGIGIPRSASEVTTKLANSPSG